MSVVGIDFGNANCTIGVARRGGIDIIVNEVSNRTTPSLVSFCDKERFIGEPAMNQFIRNYRNTISQLKRLMGKTFHETDLQNELTRLPFQVVEMENDRIGVDVNYNDEQKTFSMEQIAAMLLAKLKKTAENELKSKVTDVVISVPGYYTDKQRLALLDAASIAGLNCLRLMNDSTAVALSYGIYKTDLPEGEPVHVMFFNFGHSTLNVSIAAFNKGKLKMLSSVYDKNLGGRDFDEVLVAKFAREFKAKTGNDVYSNTRALLRLRQSCEHVKKILSGNREANINVECIMNDQDLKGNVNRDEFEEASKDLLDKCMVVVQRALTEANLTPDKLASIEIVGGASRMVSIKSRLRDFFGREVSKTLNDSETVARGCTLQCAILSPTFRVREYSITDLTPYPIRLSWNTLNAMEIQEDSAKIFTKNNPSPSYKMITFNRKDPFELKAQYDPEAVEDLPPGAPAFIGKFSVPEIPPTTAEEIPKIKVKVCLNLHGVFHVESAQLLEKIETIEEPKKEEKEEKAEAGKQASDVEMKDATPETPATPTTPETKAPESATKPSEEEKTKKFKVKKTDLKIQVQTPALTSTAIIKFREQEKAMDTQDVLVQETAAAKNQLESYIYDMRTKIDDELKDFITEVDKANFLQSLASAEEWLYGEGYDSNKQTYQKKFEELHKIGNPVVVRSIEAQTRPEAVEALLNTIAKYREFANSTDPLYDHIEKADRDKVLSECENAEKYFLPLVEKQNATPKTSNPVFLSSDILHRKSNLDNFCSAIMNKPKPKPKEEPKKEEPKKEEAKKEEAKKEEDPSKQSSEDQKKPEPAMEVD